MPRKLTHSEFMEKFYEKNSNANNIEILGEYKGSKIKILCKCRIDGYEWETKPNDLLCSNSGCPICANKNKSEIKTKTHKQFVEELIEINPNIEVLEKYQGVDTLILCKCKIDEYEWKATPHNLLSRNSGCPKCYNNIRSKSQRKTTEQFIEELAEINPNIEVLGKYINANTHIKCRCKIDNYKWEVTPSSLLYSNSGCPKCSSSKGEKTITKYLDEHNIKYIYDKGYFKNLISDNGRVLRPDFILPQYKIWIEFDGIQHFEPIDFANKGEQWAEENFKLTQTNDKIKDKYAKDNGWNLIRIPYTEIDNIEKILDEILN